MSDYKYANKTVDLPIGLWADEASEKGGLCGPDLYQACIHVCDNPNGHNRGNCCVIVYLGGHGATDASAEAVKATADRIVSTYNALAGIADPEAFVKSRANLLAACRLSLDMIAGDSEADCAARSFIRSVISLAEGAQS